jgi:hypothetical protein
MKTLKKIKGLGKQIPPDRQNVIIWFIEKGSNEITALNFFKFNQSKGWANNKGKPFKDWKMRAWEWLWSK